MIKPHFISILYGFTAFICGLLALFIHSNSLDIAIHDTYFVIPESHLWLGLTLLFILFFGISLTFELLRKPMNRILSVIHYLITIGCLVSIYLILQKSAPKRYYDYSVYDDFDQTATDYEWTNSLVLILFILFAAQFIFILNLLLSLFKKSFSGSKKSF